MSDMVQTMDVFLTIAGFILGVSFFLYLVNFADAGKKKISYAQNRNNAGKGSIKISSKETANPGKGERSRQQQTFLLTRNLTSDQKDQIKQRTCPMCGKILLRDEPLYASHTEIGREKKVLIYGCPYCYKGDRKIS
ncbi:MAG: hypothetical protein ACRCUT_04855 [Spirochaetota bacterium]